MRSNVPSAFGVSENNLKLCTFIILLQTNFTVLSEKDIRQRQDEAVATITNFLSISPVDAGVLLRHFKW